MFGTFGSKTFGTAWYIPSAPVGVGGNISLLGDPSSHGGIITASGQDGTLKVGGVVVAVNGALHTCGILPHGTTPIMATTIKSFHNGKLILTDGVIASCGAVILSPDRKVYVERA